MSETKPISGLELDQQLRAILLNATPETSLSSSAAIAQLGFPARTAFHLVSEVLAAREKGTNMEKVLKQKQQPNDGDVDQWYRVTGVIEVKVRAGSPSEAQQAAEDTLYKVLDRHAKKLQAVVGLDNVTLPDDQENLL
jgi:hypothetical protein